VRTGIVVDTVEGLVEVAGQGVSGCDDMVSGLDLDGAVAAGGPDELLNRPPGPDLAQLQGLNSRGLSAPVYPAVGS
jgi:hypothetical protein